MIFSWLSQPFMNLGKLKINNYLIKVTDAHGCQIRELSLNFPKEIYDVFITGWKGHLELIWPKPPTQSSVSYRRLWRAMTSWILSISKDRASRTSHCICSNILPASREKKEFKILNQFFFVFQFLPDVLSLCITENSLCLLYTIPGGSFYACG